MQSTKHKWLCRQIVGTHYVMGPHFGFFQCSCLYHKGKYISSRNKLLDDESDQTGVEKRLLSVQMTSQITLSIGRPSAGLHLFQVHCWKDLSQKSGSINQGNIWRHPIHVVIHQSMITIAKRAYGTDTIHIQMHQHKHTLIISCNIGMKTNC